MLARAVFHPTLAKLLPWLLRGTVAAGALVNRTIDDQEGDSVTGALPKYLPGPWNDGQTCATCHLHPGIIDASQAFDGTWSDMTYRGLGSPDQVVQMNFTGSAVYVYNIVVTSIVPLTDTRANLTFYLDGTLVGGFFQEPVSIPDGTPPQVSYNFLVYSNASLPPGDHFLQMVTSGVRPANVLFDYVVYTAEDGTPSPLQPSGSSPCPSIIPDGPSLFVITISGILQSNNNRVDISVAVDTDTLRYHGLPVVGNNAPVTIPDRNPHTHHLGDHTDFSITT